MKIPVITVCEDFESGMYVLYATSFLRTEPCGTRLFRGGELPDVAFTHSNEAEALKDCAALQTYVTLAWAGKAPRAKGREEAEEVKLTKFDFSNAVWTL